MPSGGKREGAGRKAGSVTRRGREAAERAIESGELMPLDYMLTIMRDDTALPARRDWAAEKSAPYVHPKLAAVEHSGPDGGPIEVATLSDADLAAIATGRGVRTPAPKGGKK